MSTIAPIPSPLSGAISASTRSAGALSRAAAGTTGTPTSASQVQTKTQAPALQTANAQERVQDALAQAQQKVEPGELQKQIDTVMAQANVQTSLQFRVDDDVGEVVVSVVDSDSGETIMQIPNEAALAIAKRLAEFGSGLVNQEA